HCLHELCVCGGLTVLATPVRATHGAGRGVGPETAELPIRADSAPRRGCSQLIVWDVINVEWAAVDVAQHEIGCPWPIRCRYAGILPIQTHRADGGGAGELVVVDVVDFQAAGRAVAQ